MIPAPSPILLARFRAWARVVAALAAVIGASVFVAYAIDHLTLRALAGRWLVQHLSTGLALICASVGLFALSGNRTRISLAAGFATLAIGGFVLIEHLADIAPLAVLGQTREHRMEAETAIALVALGAALGCASLMKGRGAVLAQALAAVPFLLAVLSLFGHAYSVKTFFGISAYTKMPIIGALAFCALSTGIWFARPEAGLMAVVSSDGAAGFAARRLYPAVIALPIALGLTTLIGEEARLYNGKFGLTLLVIATVAAFLVLVAVASRALDRSDHARMRLAAVLLEESERRHLARELHDEIGQSLTALKVRLEMMPEISAGVPEARALVGELMTRVSSLSLDLRPAMLDDLGLLPALVWLLDRVRAQTSLDVSFAHEGIDGRLPRETETAAFRIVQEALSNVARHSGTNRVTVRLFRRDGRLSVQVEDSGCGFDAEATLAVPTTGGLSGMRERAAALGGRLTIESSTGAGTRLCAELPT